MTMIASVFRRNPRQVYLAWDYRKDGIRGYNLYISNARNGVYQLVNAAEISNSRVKSPAPPGLASAYNRIFYSFDPTPFVSDQKEFYIKLQPILTTGAVEDPLADITALEVFPPGENPNTMKDDRQLDVHLWGWDYRSRVWRKAAVDKRGRFITVDTSSVSSSSSSASSSSVSSSSSSTSSSSSSSASSSASSASSRSSSVSSSVSSASSSSSSKSSASSSSSSATPQQP